MEELFCIGCGAQIQTEDKEKAGYTPASSIKKAEETGELYCQRCFRLVITMKLWMSTSQMMNF